jgi:hypothetical protein
MKGREAKEATLKRVIRKNAKIGLQKNIRRREAKETTRK